MAVNIPDNDPAAQSRRQWISASSAACCSLLSQTVWSRAARGSSSVADADVVPRTRSEFGTLELPRFEAVALEGLRDWLLVMDMDRDGVIWSGTTGGRFLSYTPATRQFALHDIPAKGPINACLCVGDNVYLLGREYPKLRVYRRSTGRCDEYSYPAKMVNFWYGCRVIDDQHLGLFNYAGDTVLWDCRRDTGELIRYPFEGPPAGIGYIAESGAAVYSLVFEYFADAASKYRLVKFVRLDLKQRRWSDEWAIPTTLDDTAPIRADETAGETLWHPHLTNGMMLGFDTKHRRWTSLLEIPGHGTIFSFASSGNGTGGCGSEYRGLRFYSMSTFHGDDSRGIDGNLPHYLNGLLVFDPRSRTFDMLRLDSGTQYLQTGFTLPANGQLYFHSTNIRHPDGTFGKGLNDAEGEVLFWQPV